VKIFGISSGFPLLFRSPGQVPHVLRTRSPLDLLWCCHQMDPVRLACVKHAASVRPEPGSNSPSRNDRSAEADRPLLGEQRVAGAESCPSPLILSAGVGPRHGIDVVTLPLGRSRGNARTGVPFSLPLSRSSRSRHTIPDRRCRRRLRRCSA
jgi:hypothetical protein